MRFLGRQISKRQLLIVGIVLVLVYYLTTRQSAEEQIRLRLTLLAVQASFGDVELHPLEKVGEARKLTAFFTDPLSLQVVLEGEREVFIESRKELEQRFLAAQSYLGKLEVAFSDVDVRMQRDTAQVEGTVNALGAASGTTDQFLEIHRVRISLLKEDGEWLIRSVEHLENLRGPSGAIDG